MSTRIRFAKQIIEWEARRKDGNIVLYNLPARDGGGSYEYAGINERYHPKALAKIKSLVNSGNHREAEDFAVDYLAAYTQSAASWSLLDSVNLFMRDCAFNRGPAGAAKILQRALKVDDDGAVGKKTLSALREAEKNPLLLLVRLRVARERYEIAVAGYRKEFWKGLENRWDNCFMAAFREIPSQSIIPTYA